MSDARLVVFGLQNHTHVHTQREHKKALKAVRDEKERWRVRNEQALRDKDAETERAKQETAVLKVFPQ